MPTRSTPTESAEMPLYPTEARIVAALFGRGAAREMLKTWNGVSVVLEREGLPKRDRCSAIAGIGRPRPNSSMNRTACAREDPVSPRIALRNGPCDEPPYSAGWG